MTRKTTAVFHAFFRTRGGAERLVLDLRRHLPADLLTLAIDYRSWNANQPKDSFEIDLFDPDCSLHSFSRDAKLNGWRQLKRQFVARSRSVVKQLNQYENVIFSGNVVGIAPRLAPSVRKIVYVHTPPRYQTDLESEVLAAASVWKRPHLKAFGRMVRRAFRREWRAMDDVLFNSHNVRRRSLKHLGIDGTVLHPPIRTGKFSDLGDDGYYLSYARLNETKRVPTIVNAFLRRPNQRLIIASEGPLKGWIDRQITKHGATNIRCVGLVNDEQLFDLVGRCTAGIYIPRDEDFGMTPCELMAAGKPVIGVDEGGLRETVLHQRTGWLLPTNPTPEDLCDCLDQITPGKIESMKDDCKRRAAEFDESRFYDSLKQLTTQTITKHCTINGVRQAA